MARREINSILSQIRKMAEESGVSDAELLGRYVANRDEAAFELLVRRHADLVSGVCRRVLRDFHDAEDALQATFLALARRASRVRNRESLASWLYRVAFRAALIVRAKRVKHQAKTHSLAVAGEVVAMPDRMQDEDSRTILDHEVNRLPERFRAPIVLCYLEGKTVDEAALLLGTPRGTVASRLARGRKRLHDRLNRRGVELGAGLAAVDQSHVAQETVSTILAVVRKAASAADGVISPKVLAITEEVLRAMFFQRIKTVTVTVVVAAGLLLSGGWVLHSTAVGRADDPPEPDQNPPTKVAAEQPSNEKPPDAGAQPKFIVTVSHPVKVEEAPTEHFDGVLEPLQTVNVTAQVSGRLEKVCFQPGTEVKKGDVLFEVEGTAYGTALLRAEAACNVANARKQHHDAALASLAKQFKAGRVSDVAVDEAKANVISSEAELLVARAELERAKHDLDSTHVRAPITGQIGRPLLDAGNQVLKEKAQTLATITAIDPIAVSFQIDEHTYVAYLRRVREHQLKVAGNPFQMKLRDEPGFPEEAFRHEGKLESLDGHVVGSNLQTGTVAARGIVANPDKLLLPGMTVGIRMATGALRPGLQVAWESVCFDANARNPFVLIVNKENRIEQRAVVFDSAPSATATIRDGLRPDDWVVTSKTDGLKVGDLVKPRHAETPTRK